MKQFHTTVLLNFFFKKHEMSIVPQSVKVAYNDGSKEMDVTEIMLFLCLQFVFDHGSMHVLLINYVRSLFS